MIYVLRRVTCPCTCSTPAVYILREGIPAPVAIFTHEGTALAEQVCEAMNRARPRQPKPALRLLRGGRV